MKRDALASGTSKAILQLRDGFSGEAIDGASVNFRLDGASFEPLQKGGGFYIFLHVSDVAPHEVDITCHGFFDAQVTLTAVSLPLTEPLAQVIARCDLEPSALYAYPLGTTIVRGQVTSSGKPVADAEVFACFADRLGAWQWRKTRSSGHECGAGSYRGHYVLALPHAAASAKVNLRFTKDGHASYFDRITPTRAMTTTVSADLQPEMA
jgi:hypothetical protein